MFTYLCVFCIIREVREERRGQQGDYTKHREATNVYIPVDMVFICSVTVHLLYGDTEYVLEQTV